MLTFVAFASFYFSLTIGSDEPVFVSHISRKLLRNSVGTTPNCRKTLTAAENVTDITTSMRQWESDTMSELHNVGLGSYATAFVKEHIISDQFHLLTDENLKELGLKIGERVKFRQAFQSTVDNSGLRMLAPAAVRQASEQEALEDSGVSEMDKFLGGELKIVQQHSLNKVKDLIASEGDYNFRKALIITAHRRGKINFGLLTNTKFEKTITRETIAVWEKQPEVIKYLKRIEKVKKVKGLFGGCCKKEEEDEDDQKGAHPTPA